MTHKELKLTTINGGAVEDIFNDELNKVLRNINDLNAEADSVREINIKFKLKPSKDRLTATTSIQATSKLAPHIPIAGSAFFTFDKNKPKAYAHNPNQMTLDGVIK